MQRGRPHRPRRPRAGERPRPRCGPVRCPRERGRWCLRSAPIDRAAGSRALRRHYANSEGGVEGASRRAGDLESGVEGVRTANLFVEQSACTRTAPTVHGRRGEPASRVRCGRARPVGWPWGIAPPGLPQIRACAIGAPGSSCHGLAARRTAPSRTRRHSLRLLRYPLEFRGDGAGARCLRHRSPQRSRDPVLLSLGGVPRVGSPASSVRCSTPTSP